MQDWKDSDLKALFRKNRERDREAVGPFQRDWEGARSRMAAARRISFRYMIAAVSVVVLALGTAVVIRVVRAPSKSQQRAESQDLSAGTRDLVDRPQAPQSAVSPVPEPGVVPNIAVRKFLSIKRTHPSGRARHGNAGAEAYQDQQMISTWRSPTDFLLKSLGNDLLRTLPNIEDSLVRIDGR